MIIKTADPEDKFSVYFNGEYMIQYMVYER